MPAKGMLEYWVNGVMDFGLAENGLSCLTIGWHIETHTVVKPNIPVLQYSTLKAEKVNFSSSLRCYSISLIVYQGAQDVLV